MNKIIISMGLQDNYHALNVRACKQLNVADVQRLREPVATGDEACLAFLNTPINIREDILKRREVYANAIAQELTDFVMDVLSKEDTHNGYRKDEM